MGHHGITPDGKAYVRKASKGDLTELMFDASEREMTVAFKQIENYSPADVADTVENHANDCFITDFEDALTLWGIPYMRNEKVVPLAV